MKCAKGKKKCKRREIIEIRKIMRDSIKWRERIGGKVNERDEWTVNDG